MSFLALVGQLFWFFTPTAFANMAPVLFRNYFQFLNRPIDGGRLLKGQPLFGSHKTWRGLVVATAIGGAIYALQYWLGLAYAPVVQWFPFDVYVLPWWVGFGFGAAAILGDLVKSFFKRRVGVASGETWFPFDQIDAIVASSILATVLFDFTLLMWILSVGTWIGLHIVFNHFGYWLGMQDAKW